MTYASGKAVTGAESSGWSPFNAGLMAIPGKYTATLHKRVNGVVSQLASAVEFELKPITDSAFSTATNKEVLAFGKQVSEAQKRITAVNAVLGELKKTMKTLRTAIDRTPGNIESLETRYADIQSEANELHFDLNGLNSRNRMGTKPANISSRLGYAMTAAWSSYGPTQQHKEQFSYATKRLDSVSKRVKELQESSVPNLQKSVIDAGGPWTTGAPLITR